VIDPNVAVRNWLLTSSDIVARVGDRVFCGAVPETYVADTDGEAILVSERGGTSHEYAPIISSSIQVECIAGVVQYAKTRSLYGLAYDLMHGYNRIPVNDVMVMSSIEEVRPQTSTDPDTGEAVTTGYFRMMMRAVNS
jgi:hypothetical protein